MFSFILFLLTAFSFSTKRKRDKNVIIITRNNCGFSQAMRDLCEIKDLKCLDLNEDMLSADIKAITTKPNHTYPSVFVDGTHIGGYLESEEYFEELPEKPLIKKFTSEY